MSARVIDALGRTHGSVPRVVTGGPGQGGVEGVEEEIHGPRDDDIVVNAHDRADDDHSNANTCNKHHYGYSQRCSFQQP